MSSNYNIACWITFEEVFYNVNRLCGKSSETRCPSHVPQFRDPRLCPLQTSPWPVSASELYRLSDRRLSAKIVPAFADRGYRVVSATDPPPPGRILGFLDRSRYYFFQVAPQLYSRGWVDPVPDPLLLRKSGSAGNRTRTSGSAAENSGH
jgi:hypothetical protein